MLLQPVAVPGEREHPVVVGGEQHRPLGERGAEREQVVGERGAVVDLGPGQQPEAGQVPAVLAGAAALLVQAEHGHAGPAERAGDCEPGDVRVHHQGAGHVARPAPRDDLLTGQGQH